MASQSDMEEKDYDFVEAVPERLTCTVCTKALREPRLTECCGQHFCQVCLQSWLQTHGNKTCPHCRARKFIHILDKPVKRDVSKLKVHCSHREEGCVWVGELGDLQTHLDSEEGCDFVEISCPNGCLIHNPDYDGDEDDEDDEFTAKLVQRGKLKDHLENECLLRQYECEYCGVNDTYSSITGHDPYNIYITGVFCHHDVCPEYPLACPNECGVEDIKQKDMPEHQEQCPLELVECPNKCTNSDHPINPNYDSDDDMPTDQPWPVELDTWPTGVTVRDRYEQAPFDYSDEGEEAGSEGEGAGREGEEKCSEGEEEGSESEEEGSEGEEEGSEGKEAGSECEEKCSEQGKSSSTTTTCTTVHRKDLEEHLKNECVRRPYNCEHCGKNDTYKNIMEEHYRTCPIFPRPCPNKCDTSEIKRRDMPAHRQECPLEPVRCPFEKVGCEVRLVRKDLQKHVTSETQQHLLLTFQKTCSLEQECTQLRQTCRILQTRNHDLDERCTKLEENNSKLEQQCRTLEDRLSTSTKSYGYSRPRKW